MTIYNSSFYEELGYVFNEDGDVKVVDKKSGQPVDLEVDQQEILEDAAKACIKNDIYEPEVEAEPEAKTEEVKTCYIGDVKKAEADVAKEIADQPIEVPDDIKHHLNAKDFGEYRIVISEYDDRDEIPFVGTKEELNKFIEELHLHTVPKVYKLVQLPVKTKYEVL